MFSKKVLSVALSLLMAVSTLFNVNLGSTDAVAAGSDSGYRNIAYYASWDGYARNYPLTSMDLSKITHLNFAFANLNTDGSVVVGDEWIDTQITSGVYGNMGFNWEDAEAGMAGHFGALKKLKETYPNLKTIISIGGWTWSKNFSDVAADATKRATMARTAVEFCVKYGFDGVDIDWEYPVEGGDNITHRANDGENYVLMVKAIREALNAQSAKDGKQYYLTIAAGCNPSFPKNAHAGELMQYLDWINLMSYDFHGAFDPQTNHNAPLYLNPNDTTGSTFNIDDSVKAFMAEGVAAKDMNLGLAFYGRGWVNVNATGADSLFTNGSSTSATGLDSGTWEGCSFDFWDIEDNYLGKRGYVRYWDDVAKVPYLYSTQTKTFITYDDEESIGIKLDYIKDMGLGGAMYWEASGDKKGTLLALVGNALNINNTASEVPVTKPATQPATQATQPATQATQPVTQPVTQPDIPIDDGQRYPAWQDVTAYKVGDIVSYNNANYECIYAHTSNISWIPSGAPTLWKERPDLPYYGVQPSEGSTEGGGHDNNYYVNSVLPDHIITGYWHNFCNGAATLKLSQVPSYYDLICVSFADSTSVAGEVTFNLDKDLCAAVGGYTKSEFIQDIKNLKNKGQHVILSVGGAEGSIYIKDSAASDKFAESLIKVIEEYGFEGVDIDLEGGAVAGVDYIANALRKVHDHFGKDFIITMAPETIYMQSTSASYFKLALQIKDILTIVNMQFYNSGGMIGYGGGVYSQGTVDFLTSLATLLIENGLRPDQVGIGVPSSSEAAGGGYVTPETLISAVKCMIYGDKTSGNFMPPKTYPSFRGVMTWSINWDATHNYAWAAPLDPVIHNLPSVERPEQPSASAEEPTAPATSEPVTSPEGSYDLVITDIIFDKNAKAGSNVIFTAKVKNEGNRDVPAGIVIGCSFQVDGNTGSSVWCDSYSGGIKAGDTVELTCNAGANGINYWTATAGTHTVIAFVDDVNRLPNELNEDNNRLSKTFTISSEPQTTYASTEAETKEEDETDPTPIGGEPTANLSSRLLIGYYHTWSNDGNPFIKLRDVDSNWDVINISFAEPVSAGSSDGKMKFNIPGLTADYTINDFKQDVKLLQAQGKKVVLSIGGYEGFFSLGSQQAVNQFVSDIKAIVDEYGFDGIDIDLEQSSVQFDSGNDPDINNPRSPKIVNMINAIRAIMNSYGDDFILSWAPETFYVQLGYQFYGGINQYCDTRAGVYLPMINALRDVTSYVHVQLYNSSPMIASDNVSYNMGTKEGIVAMCKMLLDGFYVNNYYTESRTPEKFFAPLRPDQVVIGVPSSASAAGSGQLSNEALQSAFDELDKAYPGIRGIMTWSINWDSSQNGNSFAQSNGAFLDGKMENVPVVTQPANTAPVVTFKNGNSVVSKVTVEAGNTVENVEMPEADGKLFAGWYTISVGDIADTASVSNYAFDFSSAITSSVTLYAGWLNIGTGSTSKFYLQGIQCREASDEYSAGVRFITKIDLGFEENIKNLNAANANIRPVDKAQTGIGYGTVLAFNERLADGKMLVKQSTGTTLSKNGAIVPAVNTYKETSTSRIYTAIVVNIPESRYDQNIAGRPYITYVDANGAEHTYYYTETGNTSHKIGGGYYINYNDALKAVQPGEPEEPGETEESTEESTERPYLPPVYAEWSADGIYVKDDYVVYNGHLYIAKWWNQNSAPGAEQWGPWELVE